MKIYSKRLKNYTQKLGYRNIQEFILELLRKKVMFEKIKRYDDIEKEMKKGKNMKKFNKEGAVKYLENL